MSSVKFSWRTPKLKVHKFEEQVVGTTLEVSIKKENLFFKMKGRNQSTRSFHSQESDTSGTQR